MQTFPRKQHRQFLHADKSQFPCMIPHRNISSGFCYNPLYQHNIQYRSPTPLHVSQEEIQLNLRSVSKTDLIRRLTHPRPTPGAPTVTWSLITTTSFKKELNRWNLVIRWDEYQTLMVSPSNAVAFVLHPTCTLFTKAYMLASILIFQIPH